MKLLLELKILWKKLDISYDDFIRTTEERHKEIVEKILNNYWNKEIFILDEYEGWYCTPCESYFTERQLVKMEIVLIVVDQ